MMKTVDTALRIARSLVWMSAVYLLWNDPRINSLWVMILICAPEVTLLTLFVIGFPKVWEHPRFNPLGENREIVEAVYGSRRSWLPYRILATAALLVGSAYMTIAGNGLTGCGETLAAVETAAIVRAIFHRED